MLLITNFLMPNDLGIVFMILFIYDFLACANTKKRVISNEISKFIFPYCKKSIILQSVYLIISEAMQYIKTGNFKHSSFLKR